MNQLGLNLKQRGMDAVEHSNRNFYGGSVTPINVRFWAKVDISDHDACWEWRAGKNHDGYGLFCIVRDGVRTTISAHRQSWLLDRGKIPEGLFVCHHCDNPGCVNPSHLFMGTHTDNMHDMIKKGRHVSPKGSKSGMAKLNENDIPKIRSLIIDGVLIKDIGEMFGVSNVAISCIKHGKTWSHVK